jgi:vacuolar-type H+-ATPase subunit F/Vma7
MKPVIVATGALADGFRLAGMPVYEVDEASGSTDHQIQAIIQAVLAQEDVGIVLVDERYMPHFDKAFEGRELPMVASFPAEEVQHEEAYIDELTRRYLGQKIYVEGE